MYNLTFHTFQPRLVFFAVSMTRPCWKVNRFFDSLSSILYRHERRRVFWNSSGFNLLAVSCKNHLTYVRNIQRTYSQPQTQSGHGSILAGPRVEMI